MKQIGLALHNYHDVNLSFPPAKNYSGQASDYSNDPGGRGLVLNTTALTMILGYMEQTPLYNAYNFSMPSSNAIYPARGVNLNPVGLSAGGMLVNTTVTSTVISTFLCPSEGTVLPYTHSTGTTPALNATLNAAIELPARLRPGLPGDPPGVDMKAIYVTPSMRKNFFCFTAQEGCCSCRSGRGRRRRVG